MLISGEKGSANGGAQQNGQQSRVQLAIAGKLPLPDDARSIDMKKAAAYLEQLNARILLPCREKLSPLFVEMKDEAENAGNGKGDAVRIAALRARLAEANDGLKAAIASERNALAGGDFESERGTLGNFGHYTSSALAPLLSYLDTLQMRMRANGDTVKVANMILDSIRRKAELFSVLGTIPSDDEKSMRLLFCAMQECELVSALHQSVKHEFDGKLTVRDEQYGGGSGLHTDREARKYLEKALACVILTNRAIRPEKKEMLVLLGRLESGEQVLPEIRVALKSAMTKIDARGSCMDRKTPEWIAQEWTLNHYINNAAGELISTVNLGMPNVLAEKISSIRGFFALLDGLKRSSLYEMKVLLENQNLNDVMQKLG